MPRSANVVVDRTAACVEYRHIGEQLLHEFLRLGFVLIDCLKRKGIGRKISIARIARCLGVGKYHLHVIANQIIPVLDLLWISCPDEKGRQE